MMLVEISCVDNLGCPEHQRGVKLHILEVVERLLDDLWRLFHRLMRRLDYAEGVGWVILHHGAKVVRRGDLRWIEGGEVGSHHLPLLLLVLLAGIYLLEKTLKLFCNAHLRRLRCELV